VPIELLILILTITLAVVQVVMARSGPVRRDQRGRSPFLLGELNPLVHATLAVARPRPIYLKIRSSRAPPTFPTQLLDRRPGLIG
jgi:hypothetical protein